MYERSTERQHGAASKILKRWKNFSVYNFNDKLLLFIINYTSASTIYAGIMYMYDDVNNIVTRTLPATYVG